VNYFNFHIGDYLSHTAHLDDAEDLAYRRLLDVYYLREKPYSEAVTDICKLIRMRGQESVVQAVLTEFFTLDAGTWTQPRCDDELVRMADKRQKAKESADASWASRRGKQLPVKDHANAMRPHSERIARDDANALLPTPTPTPIKKKEKAPPFDLNAITGLDMATFEKWLGYRKEIGKALKPASIEAAAREMARFGAQQAAVVQQSIAQGWQGLFAIKVVTGAQVPDAEGLALKKLTDRREAIGLPNFRTPNAGEASKDYRAAQDKAWMEAKSEKAEEPAPVDTSRNVARVSGLLQGFGRMGVGK
jgi:uncharacterized protein YdaU (DUF1376 family)